MKVKGLILGLWVVCGVALLSCGGGGRNADSGEHFNPQINNGSFTDPRDNKTYRTVRIGNRTWMAENLNYQTDGSWCYGDDDANCATYGRLYIWEAAMTACPAGWRLPSDEDWKDLTSSVGGTYSYDDDLDMGYWENAGTKLRSRIGWNSYDPHSYIPATDDFGFSAIPGGHRSSDVSYGVVGYDGHWWSATEGGSGRAGVRVMSYSSDGVDEGNFVKSWGYSVRCVRD